MFLCVLDMGMHVLSARLLTSFMHTPEHGMTGLNVLPRCSPHSGTQLASPAMSKALISIYNDTECFSLAFALWDLSCAGVGASHSSSARCP